MMTSKKNLLALAIIASAIIATTSALYAQESAATDSGTESSGYENEIAKPTKLLQEELNGKQEKTEDNSENSKLNKISELGTLAPFSDIAVIQKKYLPKTGRFEIFPNIGFVTNNAFFFSAFLQSRFAYGITEAWSVEATASIFTNSKYNVTKELKDKDNVDTESHLLTRGYYGLDARWSPIYGKMGMFSDGIMPFDIYFSAGLGMMTTNQNTSPIAFHAGAGQIFALKKWMSFRWDLSGYFYSSDTNVTSNGTSGTKHESFQDIQFGIGMSFFFPDAKYR